MGPDPKGTGFAAQVVHLAGGRGTGGVARQAPLARLHELLRPRVIHALGDDILAAQLGDAVLAAQAFQTEPAFVLCSAVPERRTTGIAACRRRVCTYVEISVLAVAFKKK